MPPQARVHGAALGEWALPEGNVLGAPAGEYGPCADAGYYLLLPPLPPGEHTLRFGGEAESPGGPLSVDVTYHLTVARGSSR
jgi:hypothetical protein